MPAHASTGGGDSTGQVLDVLARAGKLTDFQIEKIREGKLADIRFDDYVLIDRLGKGGMGEVFKARNVLLGRIEAIKTVVYGDGYSDALSKRFQREAQVLARLEHPAIVPIYKIGRFAGIDFIAMKLVEGEDLKKRVEAAAKQHRQIPVATACRWISEAADALDHAHRQGIIHRDIKPGNLHATKEDKIVVLDLGIARLTGADTGKYGGGLTLHKGAMGTPDFMPPEQWSDATAVTPASDIYALGGTFYYLLTGKPPFEKPNMVELMTAHTCEIPRGLRQLRPDVPIELEAVILKMLAKKPIDRYDTAREVVEALKPFAAADYQPPKKTKVQVHDKPGGGGGAGKSVLLAGGVLALVAVVGLGAYFGRGLIWKEESKDDRNKSAKIDDVSKTKPVDDGFAKQDKKQTAKVDKKPADDTTGKVVKPIDDKSSKPVTTKKKPEKRPKTKTEPQPPTMEQQVTALLVERQRKASELFKTPDALRKEIEVLVDPDTVKTESDLKNFAKRLDKLIADRAAEARHGKLLAQAEAYLEDPEKVPPKIWPDRGELRQFVDSFLKQRRLDSDDDLNEFRKALDEETNRLRHPFEGLKLENARSDEDRQELALICQLLPRILGLHPVPQDREWKFTCEFVEISVLNKNPAAKNAKKKPAGAADSLDERSVTRARVSQNIYLGFRSSLSCFVTAVIIDENQIYLRKIVGKKLPASLDERQVATKDPFPFPTAGKKRVIIYATTDEPLLSLDILKTETRRVVSVQADNPADLPGVFSSPRIYPRILSAFGKAAPLPGVEPNIKAGKWTRALAEVEIKE